MNGKWSAVSQVDSMQLANVPMQMDSEFRREIDMNPNADRRKDHWKWVKAGYIENEKKIQCFYRDHDVDTVEEDWALKEVIPGVIIDRKGSNNTSGWSIVVRTVIRWEERNMRVSIRVAHHRAPVTETKKPEDVQRWEESHGTRRRCSSTLRASRRNVRRRSR